MIMFQNDFTPGIFGKLENNVYLFGHDVSPVSGQNRGGKLATWHAGNVVLQGSKFVKT